MENENGWDNIAGELKVWRILLFLYFSSILVSCAHYDGTGLDRMRDANYSLQAIQQQEQMRALENQQRRLECLQRQQQNAQYSGRVQVNTCY